MWNCHSPADSKHTPLSLQGSRVGQDSIRCVLEATKFQSWLANRVLWKHDSLLLFPNTVWHKHNQLNTFLLEEEKTISPRDLFDMSVVLAEWKSISYNNNLQRGGFAVNPRWFHHCGDLILAPGSPLISWVPTGSVTCFLCTSESLWLTPEHIHLLFVVL